MPWGECTVTLDDVAYQLGVPINGEPVSGCLWDFENMMPEGTVKPRWDWFQEMFGELPDENDRDPYTVTFSWLKSRFGDLPRDASDELVLWHAERTFGCCCRLVFSGTRLELRLTACVVVQESVPSSQQECRPGGRAVRSAAKLDFLAVSGPSALRFRRHQVAIGLQVYRYLPTSDEKRPRLQAHRRQLDLMPSVR
ncbi:hypothetical protein PIB30_064151 [Stylosanthes scabra]|uniref:Aminotransferase-like plant mobile domain-containing protein n=1 Tax=Stylosanthes scabra TaxID=79078 RepID=A0ABU6TMK7_9FABA|nr:hypothetical protein [Stylosanthes scabra]